MSEISYERRKAVAEAWKDEKELVMEGKGTRDWSREEQKEILEVGKARGYQGHHMKSVDGHNSKAGDAENIQFLTQKEHLAAHGGDFHNNTNGYYDPQSGKMNEFGRYKAHVEPKDLTNPLSESEKNEVLNKGSKPEMNDRTEAARQKARETEARSVQKSKSSSQVPERAHERPRSKTLQQPKSASEAPAETGSKTLSAQRSEKASRAGGEGKAASEGESASSEKAGEEAHTGSHEKGNGHRR